MKGVRAVLVSLVLTSMGVLMSSPAMAQYRGGFPGGMFDPNDFVARGRFADEAEAAAPDTNDIGNIRVRMNFQDAPIQVVLEYLSEKTGLTIVSGGAPTGRVNVISRQEVPLDTAIGLINSVLVESDMTAVRTEDMLKIVTIDQARQMNIPFSYGADPNAIPEDDVVITHVLPLRYVSAASLRQNLLALMPEYAIMEANIDGNSLIITDTRANIRRLMRIVEALDTHMASVAEIRVFRLFNADATSAANLVNSIFQQSAGGSTSASSAVDMIMQRGGRGGGPMGRDMGGSQSTSSGSGQGQVIASADSRTNSVVVRGPSDAITIIAAMLDQLDSRETETAHVKVFQLRYADALNVADIVNQLFGDAANSSNNQGAQAVFQRGGRGGGPGGDFGDFGMQDQSQSQGSQLTITAAADSQTNTVVVTGPEAMLEIVAEVITGLDKAVPNVADVQVFHLKYADATNVASLINEIFSASTNSSGRSSSQQNQQVQFGGRGGFAQTTAQTGGATASDVAVVASADSRTNSVVVAGPPETMGIVAGIIEDLDQNPEQERQIFVYALKNGTASNIVTILNSIFDQMQSLNQQGTGRTGGQQFQGATGGGTTTTSSSSSGNDLSEETYFEADEETNSVLVMTSTKNYEKIQPILDKLDKQVGQVLIKCLFAEITHSNNVDLGTEFSAWNLRGAGDSNNVEFGTVFGAPSGGLTASVFDNTLDLTVRALQDTGKLNILSRPYILTSNQQEASIIVGNRVPFATGTTTVAGQTQITTEYQDIGISLSVTPSINPDGLVIMTVSPEISSTTGDEIRVSTELSLPVFATRSSTTRVAVRDGQTIVIGGLIQDEIRDTVSKVPVLGDIPLLGRLFSRTQKDKSKTELLIFLTPHVAPDALTLQAISDAERGRSNLGNDATIADIYQGHLLGLGGPHNITLDDPNRP